MFLARSLFPALTLAALALPVAAQQSGAPAKADKPAATATPAAQPAPAAPAATHTPEEQAIIDAQKPSYPLKTCVVSGDTLGGEHGPVVDVVRDGRLIEFCCNDCIKDFDKAAADYEKKIDLAVVAAQKPGYPMKTCVVRGDALKESNLREVVFGTRLAEVCCGTCKKKFLQNPQTYIDKLNAALIEQQSRDYPLTTCVVSGEKLDTPEKFLYGTTLVEFCCKDCKKEFAKDPATFLEKLAAARAAHASGGQTGSAPATPASKPAGAGHAQGG